MTDKESAIYSTGYWNGIAYKRQRELTDEEITEVWTNIPESPDDIWAFARAILKKAQEISFQNTESKETKGNVNK